MEGICALLDIHPQAMIVVAQINALRICTIAVAFREKLVVVIGLVLIFNNLLTYGSFRRNKDSHHLPVLKNSFYQP